MKTEEECYVKTEDCGDVFNRRNARDCWQATRSSEEAWKESYRFQRDRGPADTSISDFQHLQL